MGQMLLPFGFDGEPEILKRCGKCDKAKPISCFYRSKANRDGRHAWCGECLKLWKPGKNMVCKGCGDRFQPKRRATKAFCSPKCHALFRNSHLTDEDRKKISDHAKTRTKENHPRWNPDRDYIRRREKLRGIVTTLVRRCLSVPYSKKGAKSEALLGYKLKDLRLHLEKLFKPGMTWENYGVHGWHVDHVRPLSSFPEGTPISEINALENLQPLWSLENILKRDKWDGDKKAETSEVKDDSDAAKQ